MNNYIQMVWSLDHWQGLNERYNVVFYNAIIQFMTRSYGHFEKSKWGWEIRFLPHLTCILSLLLLGGWGEWWFDIGTTWSCKVYYKDGGGSSKLGSWWPQCEFAIVFCFNSNFDNRNHFLALVCVIWHTFIGLPNGIEVTLWSGVQQITCLILEHTP
jgi:hypothetical protein